MKWEDKKAAIIAALEEYGYKENNGNWQKSEGIDGVMVATVWLKTQPKPGEEIQVKFINSIDLDAEPSSRDINGVLGATKQVIRTAINNMENGHTDQPVGQPVKQTEQPDTQSPEQPDELTTEQPDIEPTKPHQPSNKVAVRPDERPSEIPDLSIEIIQQYINPDATIEQAYNFMQLCISQDLNPFIGEAHLIIFKGKAKMVIGVGGLMRRAQEMSVYDGYEAGIIVQKEDGSIDERIGTFMTDDETLLGGWCKSYRKGRSKPGITKVSLNEYIQRTADGTPTKVWITMPATMICKVAKSQEHRDNFMDKNSGLYEQVEMTDLGEVEVV